MTEISGVTNKVVVCGGGCASVTYVESDVDVSSEGVIVSVSVTGVPVTDISTGARSEVTVRVVGSSLIVLVIVSTVGTMVVVDATIGPDTLTVLTTMEPGWVMTAQDDGRAKIVVLVDP